MGHVRPQEDATRQWPDVAQHVQEGRASHPHHRAVEGLSRRRLDRAVSYLQTQVRQEGRGVHRRRARLLGKMHFNRHHFLAQA